MSLVRDLQDLEKFYIENHPHEWSANDVEIFLCHLQSALLTAMTAESILREIVCVEGEDAGVLLKDSDAPTQYSETLKCHVYTHDYFSPMGDALIHLWRTVFETEDVESEEQMS